ncbi:TIR domain-containing protein [Streptococcus constellatus]|uniref:TIR domain-containing protein n=1 Tax=Streptococcus constellatus TaxID=76860 RepID=UPI0028EF2586|nr:TIR domain-containing protein [Streptococcus constellatus]
MSKIFIAHAWSDDREYNDKQLSFIRLLQLELEHKGLEVVFDDSTINKDSLNRFMIENVKNSDIIIAICDEYYLKKSEDLGSGVSFELKEIRDHNFLDKVIPLKISECDLPYDFGTMQYISFKNEFENQLTDFETSASLRELFVRIADFLSKEELYPKDPIKPEILSEINSLGLLSNVLNNSDLTLSDIYTYPEFSIESEKEIKYISVKKYFSNKKYLGKSIIVGDRQSGKSSLSKKLFLDLYDAGYQPVFLEKEDFTSRQTDKIISQKYIKTYLTTHRNKPEKIIVLVDDYHALDLKYQRDILELSNYVGILIFVDDIFDISFPQKNLFLRYTIQPMKPTLRAELIKNLIHAQKISFANENDLLKKIDESTNLINTSLGLGKGYKNGIVPAFPLYILTILGASADVRNKLDSPISSYGHCYQLLISLTFQNCGIENDAIDSYINLLTYLAGYLYHEDTKELTQKEFEKFLEVYKKDYRIYKEDEYLSTLFKTGLIKKNNFAYYVFNYDYIYYFFLGKYFSESFDEEIESIQNIVNHLDFEENGNICIFIAHHSKNPKLIKMLQDNLSSIFNEYTPAKLDKDELRKLDDGVKELLADIEPKISDYEEERKKRLEKQDKLEGLSDETNYESERRDLVESDRQNDVRRAIQTVEVIGIILKNRHGSIKRSDYETLLQGAVDANLRLLSSFIKIVSNDEFVKNFEETVFKLDVFEDGEINQQEFRKKFSKILLTMNFATIYGIVIKTIDSIGSEVVSQYFSELIKMQNFVPSYMLIHRGMELKYEKRPSRKEISRELRLPEMSNIAQSIIKLMVIDHASNHKYSYKEKSQIESEFGFKPNAILEREKQLKLLDR